LFSFDIEARNKKKITQIESDRNEKYAVQKGHQNVIYYWLNACKNT